MLSNFNLDWPVFVWVAIVGVIVCIVLGACRGTNKGSKRSDTNSEVFASLIVSGGFGIMTVITCLKYSMVMPSFWLWKSGLFALAVIAMILLTILFWGLTNTVADLFSTADGGEKDGRKHHRQTR